MSKLGYDELTALIKKVREARTITEARRYIEAAYNCESCADAHFWTCECGAENYGFETCQYCGRSERC